MNDIKTSVGNKIKAARINKGLTQQQLTEQLNKHLPAKEIVERTMISRWEKDLHFPRNNRREIIEKILDIKIGNPPIKINSTATYIPYQDQIADRLAYGLKSCKELWITSANSQSGVWQNISVFNRQFEKLRASQNCLVKEMYYIQTLEDIKKVRVLATSKYPNYRLSVRIAPGQPLPILHIPDKKFGVILSGFGSDLRNVGLELDGQLASFSEHTFRYRWLFSTCIIGEDSKVNHENIKLLTGLLKELGGSTHRYLSPH